MFLTEPIWVIITVAEGGVLAVTQQLSRFGTDFVQNPVPQNVQNPFLSPTRSNHSVEDSNNMAVISPNSSVLAQHGSPYISQLSPSPDRTQRPDQRNGLTPARSLFQVI